MVRHAIIPAVLLLAVIPVEHAWAQASGGENAAEIQVLAIRATTKNTVISPELRELAEALKKQFKFTGFSLERKARGRVKLDEPFKTGLIGGYRAEITPKAHDGQRVTLALAVYEEAEKDPKPRLKLTFTIPVKKFHLSGGFSLGSGDALILAVSAR